MSKKDFKQAMMWLKIGAGFVKIAEKCCDMVERKWCPKCIKDFLCGVALNCMIIAYDCWNRATHKIRKTD